MDEQRTVAETAWVEAQKIRKKLNSELQALQVAQEVGDLGRYENLEEIMAKYRFSCVKILVCDPEFFSETVQEVMWQSHSQINEEYRRILSHIRGSRLAVLKNKLEKMYLKFLKTSFEFYRYYVQQLASKYDLPELTRAANKANLQGPMSGAEKPVKEVSQSLRHSLLWSCVSAIIHLGDIVRYRQQLRSKKSTKDARKGTEGNAFKDESKDKTELGALDSFAYYSLACQLMPDSGHAYHQIGVSFLGKKNDFELVFWFSRALAVEKPHKLALQNLEQELKSLRTSNAASSAQSSDYTTTFIMWFLRLHGHYNRGENFPQQQELEKEVLHRLEMSVIRERDGGIILMKMVLINIASRFVANGKLSYEHSPRSVRYCHFTLRLNVLYCRVLVRVLVNELERLKDEQLEWDLAHPDRQPSGADDKRPKATQTLRMALPLVRLYASWLVACRLEVRSAPPDLQMAIVELGNDFASSLTLLAELYSTHIIGPAPYLLPEDTLGIGMLPLYSPEMPPQCLLSFDQDAKAAKPWRDELNEPALLWNQDREHDARVFDILCCGYFLTEDACLPLSMSVLENSALLFTYGDAEATQSSQPQGSGSALSEDLQPQQANNNLRQHGQNHQNNIPAARHNGLGASAEAHHQSQGHVPERAQKSQQANVEQRRQMNTEKVQQLEDTARVSGPRRPEHSALHAPAQRGGSLQPRGPGHQRGASHDESFSTADKPDSGKQVNYPTSSYPSMTAAMRPHERQTEQRRDAWTNQQPKSRPLESQEDTTYDFSNNPELMSMIGGLLQPPTASHHVQATGLTSHSSPETSYGMHTATANEVFGAVHDENPQAMNSPSWPRLPTLGWDFYYSPQPKDMSAQMTPPQSAASVPQSGNENRQLQNGMTAMALHDTNQGMPHLAAQQAMRPNASSPAEDKEAHRNRLLQGFFQGNSSLGPTSQASPGSYQQQYPYTTSFPESSGLAFSNPDSLYQGTPQPLNAYRANPQAATPLARSDGHVARRSPFQKVADEAGMNGLQNFTDGYQNRVFQSARPEATQEQARQKRKG